MDHIEQTLSSLPELNLQDTPVGEKCNRIKHYLAMAVAQKISPLKQQALAGKFDCFEEGTNLQDRFLEVQSRIPLDTKAIAELATSISWAIVTQVNPIIEVAKKKVLMHPEIIGDKHFHSYVESIFAKQNTCLMIDTQRALQNNLEERMTRTIQSYQNNQNCTTAPQEMKPKTRFWFLNP